MDFNDSTQIITFTPSNANNDITVYIPIFDDEINEADEGFMILLELVDSNLADSVYLSRNCTLGRIDDNDRKCLLLFAGILKSVC